MALGNGTKITWFGHSTFVFETAAGKRIMFDPWITGNPATPGEHVRPRADRRDPGVATATPTTPPTWCGSPDEKQPKAVVGMVELDRLLRRARASRTPSASTRAARPRRRASGHAHPRAPLVEHHRRRTASIVYLGDPAGFVSRSRTAIRSTSPATPRCSRRHGADRRAVPARSRDAARSATSSRWARSRPPRRSSCWASSACWACTTARSRLSRARPGAAARRAAPRAAWTSRSRSSRRGRRSSDVLAGRVRPRRRPVGRGRGVQVPGGRRGRAVGARRRRRRGDPGARQRQLRARTGSRSCGRGSRRRSRSTALLRPTTGARSASWAWSTAQGGSATFTGSACVDWAGGRTGPCYAAQGNILAGAGVVDALVQSFEASAGPARRAAARRRSRPATRAGGDRRGRQSACVIVRQHGAGYGGNNDILVDLRVDDHPEPVTELPRLYDIHDLLFGTTPDGRAAAARRGRGELGRAPGGCSASRATSRPSPELGRQREPRGAAASDGSIDPVVLRVLRHRADAPRSERTDECWLA